MKTPTQSDAAPRWRRYAFRFVWLMLVVALMAGGRAWYMYSRNNSALQKAIEATTAADPRWRIEDIIADWPAVADEANSALVIISGNRLIDRAKLNVPTDNEEPPPPNCEMNEAQLKHLRANSAPYQPALTEYRKLGSMPSGRYPITGTPDITSQLNRATPFREPSIALQYDFLAQLEAKDDADAALALRAALNVPPSAGQEAFAIPVLVRIATLRSAIASTERWLGISEPDAAHLADIQLMLEREASDPLLPRFARAERASAFFQTGQLPQTIAAMAKPTNPWDAIQQSFGDIFIQPGFIAEQQTAILTHMNAFVAIAQLPDRELQAQLKQWQASANNSPVLMKLMVPAVVKVVESIQRSRAQTQCAIVGLAAERFRRQTGHWPTTLDELVPAKLLSAVPLDPFDNQPLQWKLVPDGGVVYPICNDTLVGTTSAGAASKNDRAKILFRLYDPDKRRQPPRPVKAKEPEKDQALPDSP